MTEYRVQSTEYRRENGAVLILTFIVMAALIAITAAFLSMASVQLKGSGYDVVSSKALWLAEAGLQKAVWYLETPVGSGGYGEDWTTAGTTETLGNGSYTMVVARWDFALAANDASSSTSSENGSYVAANAIDGNDLTYWQSTNKPVPGNSEEIIITFPSILTINKVRFLVPPGSSQQAPKDYTWGVSSDGINYTTVVSCNNNNNTDVTDTFTAVYSVKYLKLNIAKIGGDSGGAIIATLEAIGSKITSLGTVSVMNRKIEQTAVADDATQTAADEIDWNEIVPAT